MGLMQRTKGKVFERRVADELRQHWPLALVRRGSQAERADMPDVFFTVPKVGTFPGYTLLSRLWIECQDSRTPTPTAKLEQAERDVHARCIRAYPIAVTHKLGSREILATMRLSTAHYFERGEEHFAPEVITMDLPSLFAVLTRAIERGVA